jgi:diacylglycerol kinase family enzyme
VDAAGRLIEDLASGHERCIGLGTANGRYFTFNAGLGLDAEVVRAVEGRRAHGLTLTPARYARTALRQYFQVTDRRQPAVSITAPAGLCPEPVYECIISNSAPWTYLGRKPVNTNPDASFDTGLDLLALRSLGTIATARTLRQMLADRSRPPRGRSVVAGHDLTEIELSATRPVAFQLDGEYMGELEHVRFRSVPRALRVIGLATS